MIKEEIYNKIGLLIEIDTEKKVVCITDYYDKNYAGGIAKRYKNKKDISRIIDNYLYYDVSIKPIEVERKIKNGRRKNRKKSKQKK